ncbi:Nuclease precursor [compost metagenome]
MKISLFFLYVLFPALVFSQAASVKPDTTALKQLKASPVTNLEIPKTGLKEEIITHAGYSLVYNEKHEQASWVAYELTKEETQSKFKRPDKFQSDPMIKTGTADGKDYEGSNYDRGHLAPAADMCWSEITASESFYYSNMSPQAPGFNRGIWKKTEKLVRDWAIENSSLYIVTGPVLCKGLKTIGENKVSVPKYYYKVILDYSNPDVKGIGFVIPNDALKNPNPPSHYAVSIDSVEQLTGIDFFPALPDDQEALIEKTLCIDCWSWKTTVSSTDLLLKFHAKAGKIVLTKLSPVHFPT